MALSDKDREFLSAMVSDAKESRVADIAERMNVTIDYLQKYRKRLIEFVGVIEPAGRGYVRYAVPYIQEYLRKRLREPERISNVVEEVSYYTSLYFAINHYILLYITILLYF